MPPAEQRSISADEAAKTALQFLNRGRADLANPLVDALMRAMPGHQVVQRLNLLRRIVALEESASRAPVALARRAPVKQEDIDLVAFHVDLPRAPSGLHAEINYHDVLRLAFQSAALRAPGARRVILTDEATRFPDDIGAHAIQRFSMDARLTMFERTRAQVAYLKSLAPERACVLMDSDIIVNRDPAEAFELDFDVGLTWRTGFPDAPFNGGLLLIGRADRGAIFMSRVLDCYTRLTANPDLVALTPSNLKSWWGDQYALGAVVGFRAFGERTSDATAIDGIRTAFLPCADYNLTLEANQQYDAAELRRKFFIHFKGNRKAMAADYLRRMASGQI